jgi:hypothetical protein
MISDDSFERRGFFQSMLFEIKVSVLLGLLLKGLAAIIARE